MQERRKRGFLPKENKKWKREHGQESGTGSSLVTCHVIYRSWHGKSVVSFAGSFGDYKM
jgi:hypothetical protein